MLRLHDDLLSLAPRGHIVRCAGHLKLLLLHVAASALGLSAVARKYTVVRPAKPKEVRKNTATISHHTCLDGNSDEQGANSYGQLGQSHQDDQLLPGMVCSIGSPECLTGGGGHTLVVVDGDVYSCGSNNKGQLGLGHKQDVSSLQRVTALSDVRVVRVSGGWDFSVALSDAGKVYAWGSNAFGQLGSSDAAQQDQPVLMSLGDKRVVDVRCGLRHTVLLTVQLPEGGSRVTQVAAGAYHTAGVTDGGQVIVWGDNKHGQCCEDPGTAAVLTRPRVVPGRLFHDKPVCQVYSGWTHLLSKTEDGSLYSWGRNDYGQLGRHSSSSSRGQGAACDHRPIPVPVPRTNTAACGSEHNVALLENGSVVSWGWNEHGMCGTGDETNVLSPGVVTALSGRTVLQVGCGTGHSLAVVAAKPDPS